MNIKKWFEDDKIILHMFYFIVILIIFCIELFTVRGYSNEGLDAQLSFAGTLSGIILSVLAIMLTLFSEFKSDNTKDTLERVSRQIQKVTEDTLINVTEQLKQATRRIDESTEKLEDASALKEEVKNIGNIMKQFSSTNKSANGQEGDLMSSYSSVFKDYVDARPEELRKEIYILVYSFISDPKSKYNTNYYKDILNFVLGKISQSIFVSIGIIMVFSQYIESNNDFLEYIKDRSENEYPEETNKVKRFLETKLEK